MTGHASALRSTCDVPYSLEFVLSRVAAPLTIVLTMSYIYQQSPGPLHVYPDGREVRTSLGPEINFRNHSPVFFLKPRVEWGIL
ncbi:hypothetical protein BDQ12DRAFT_675713 [Crucibulum laeve]|uniref:Uncharacterized protein n=1 Tax=Crucibulum laeve TaxID=68775 RepID=A0A5C3MHM1_9AGAR|nr:hypothetical protein BDQ12DRAFT_675713 [Crucibulum laeve]